METPMAIPSASAGTVTPRVIIHGGAGNITRDNLPPSSYDAYRHSLLNYVQSTSSLLSSGSSALDAAVHAVSLLEDDPLFNCGRGAVFTRAGTIELEASVMVSRGYRKRGAGITLVKKVKNPIKLAREILIRGETDGGKGLRVSEDSGGERGGAQGHVFLAGQTCIDLAEEWGLDIVDEDYHWTRRRWEEHRRGLEREAAAERGEDVAEASKKAAYADGLPDWAEVASEFWGPNAHWDGKEYLPQGTVGAVCLDKYGTIAVATSTGGLTNKLPGRVGDTPTFGAGFWAEEWEEKEKEKEKSTLVRSQSPSGAEPNAIHASLPPMVVLPPVASLIPTSLKPTIASCMPASWAVQLGLMSRDGTITPPNTGNDAAAFEEKQHLLLQASSSIFSSRPATRHRAVGMSGTGNGDSFLRLCATRTAGSIVRFASVPPTSSPCLSTLSATPADSKPSSLQTALTQIVGPDGEMQRSAGDRWGHTGEGEGGTIGIELGPDGVGRVAADLNCGGMFRAWVDDEGRARMMVFRGEY